MFCFSIIDTKSAEGGKLLRDKQIEERKRKNAERKAAVEDRRKQKEREDRAKNEALRYLLDHKPLRQPVGSYQTYRAMVRLTPDGKRRRREGYLRVLVRARGTRHPDQEKALGIRDGI
jgi:hypothetical protein